MRDGTGDAVVVDTDSGEVSLDVTDTSGSASVKAQAIFSPKKARKLARKLLAAADEIDGGESAPARASIAELSARQITGQIRRRLDEVEAEQRWDREQIVALMRAMWPETPGEVAEPEAESVNATPIDDGQHYLLPRAWLIASTKRLGEGHDATFRLPPDAALADRVSTGFDEPIRKDTARKVRLATDDLRDALLGAPVNIGHGTYEAHLRPLIERLYNAVGGA